MKTTPEELKAAQALPTVNAPATPVSTLAEIGMALTGVIDRPGLDPAIAGELTAILEAIIKTEALTHADQEKALAATESLLDGEETVLGLIDYIGTEERPPGDLFTVLLRIQDGIQGALPLFRDEAAEAAAIKAVADRICDLTLTRADYEFARRIRRGHPGYRHALAVALAWEKGDPETPDIDWID